MAHDWFDWTNAAIGGLGLLITIGALWQATGAKKAAREARDKIVRRDVFSEIARIERILCEFQSALRSEKNELISLLAREFVTECSRTRERYADVLGQNAADKLISAIDMVELASKVIKRGENAADYFDEVDGVLRDLSGIEGKLSWKMDREGQ